MRRRAAALAGLCLVVAACSPGGRATPLRHLADENAKRRGDSEPPTVQIGSTTRYVLGPGPGRWQLRSGITDARGRSRVEVACDAHLAGRPVLARVRTFGDAPGEDADIGTRLLRRRCPADPAAPLVLDVAGRAPGTRIGHLVRVGELPPSIVTTPSLELPAEAELRLDVGVLGESDERPLRVAVRAVGPSGARIVLLRTTVAPDNRWHPLRVPLARARKELGREVRLELKRETSHGAESAALVAFGNPILWGRSTPPAGRNVVLISIDTLRADRLGSYGYPLAVSPVLDAVAREGTLFENALAQASWTTPSHATMLTGTYSCVHGLGINEYDRRPAAEKAADPLLGRPLPVGVRPLAEILRDAGYGTAAFTEDAFVDPGSFQRGFDEFTADKRFGWAVGIVEDTMRSAVDWLRVHAEQRFFLFVHTYQVHSPYTPPPAYDHIASLRPLPLAPNHLPPAPKGEADAARYVAEVAYTDASVAALFQALAELGLAEQTIVVVTSDHGEAFGEQGAWGHAWGIKDEQLHVPLIWRAPGLIAAGRRISAMVGVVDIAPTVLALLGMEVPSWMQGESLAPMLAPDAPAPASAPARRVLPAEGYSIQGVRGATWKVTRRPSRSTLVTVAETGAETRVVHPARPLLEEPFATVARECERARAVLGPSLLTAPEAADPGFDAERERKLRALGYLE